MSWQSQDCYSARCILIDQGSHSLCSLPCRAQEDDLAPLLIPSSPQPRKVCMTKEDCWLTVKVQPLLEALAVGQMVVTSLLQLRYCLQYLRMEESKLQMPDVFWCIHLFTKEGKLALQKHLICRDEEPAKLLGPGLRTVQAAESVPKSDLRCPRVQYIGCGT